MSDTAKRKGVLLDLHCYGGLFSVALGAGLCTSGPSSVFFSIGVSLVVAGAGLFYLAMRRA